MTTITDHHQRQQALDPNQSFAVSAPAGSGKTELLTQRVLKLLAQVDKPEEILCLTFTRKAAGEMTQRIIAALQLAREDIPPEQPHAYQTWQLAREALQQDAKKNWQLLQSPNRLRIQTIDGFCRNLAQQLSLESGLNTTSEPLDQPAPHYREAASEFLLNQLNRNGYLGDAVGTLLQHLDNNLNKLEQLLIGLLEKREQWLQHLISARDARPYLEQFLQQTIQETLETLAAQLQPVASDLCLLADYAAQNLVNRASESTVCNCLGLTGLPPCTAEAMAQWQGLVNLLITASDSDPGWRTDRGINIKLGFPTAKDDPEFGELRKTAFRDLLSWCRDQSGLLDTLLEVRYLPSEQYSDSQWQTLDALTKLLPALAAQLQLHFQQESCCDFTEITLAAQRALGDQDNPTDLTLSLDYRIQHILIDEFQDTSSIQFDILRLLTQGWQIGDGRSLFIVGDGMQSLYGFRNANVGLFLEARSQPIGNIELTPLDLQVNFRSQAGIIDWVNDVFKLAFPSRDNIARGAVCYAPATPFHPALDGNAVTVDAFFDHPDHIAEATRIVELVSEARLENPKGSIAILVRNRRHLENILPALHQAGHRWQASDIDPLAQRMPVIDLMSLTRALLSPADRIAWLSILRAPWCGLDLYDLYYLANTPITESPATASRYPLLLLQLMHYQQVSELSESGKKILQRISDVIIPAWQQRQRLPLRNWVESVWQALGGPSALRQPADMDHCLQYFDLLEGHNPITDWPTFEQAVTALYAAPDPVADSSLQIMTIHKAKGLEFDTVIIPGLNRSGGNDKQQLLMWRERITQKGQQQLLIGPLQASGDDKDPLYRHLQQETKEKNRLESTRVIYVGATRAISKLHLLFNIRTGKKPANNSLLARLWPWMESAVQQRHPCVSTHQFVDTTEEREYTKTRFTHIHRLSANWQQNTVVAKLRDIQNPPQKTGSSSAVVIETLNSDARHTGTVLHRILKQITYEGVHSWSTQTVTQRLTAWDLQLRYLGMTNTEQALIKLQQAVITMLNDPKAQWLLDHQHQHSQCELPLGYLDEEQQPRTAIIDRTFIDNGIRWVVDYKSSQPDENESVDAFLAQQKSTYRHQLALYEKLFRQLESLPVRTALYFPFSSIFEVFEGQ